MYTSATLAQTYHSTRHMQCWKGVFNSHLSKEEWCSFEQDRGVIGIAKSDSLSGPWETQGPVAPRVNWPFKELRDHSAFTEMERPQVSFDAST